jgi:MraZ protein
VRWFKLRVSRKGTPYEIDSKGRVLISQALRERTNLDEEVELIGLDDHIEVWNRDILDDKLDKNPLTDKDFEQISKLGRKEGEE